MTTQDVIQSLLDAGWRYERLGAGLAPMLTNAEEGMRFCPQCGSWQTLSNFAYKGTGCVCRSCHDRLPESRDARPFPRYSPRGKNRKRQLFCRRGHLRQGVNIKIRHDGYYECIPCRQIRERKKRVRHEDVAAA